MKTTRSYTGEVLMCWDAIQKLCPDEAMEFGEAETETTFDCEDEYKLFVREVNGKQLPSKCKYPRLTKAARELVKAVRAKGVDLITGYIYNECEAEVVFGFNFQVINYTIKPELRDKFEALGLDIDSVYMDSTSYLPY